MEEQVFTQTPTSWFFSATRPKADVYDVQKQAFENAQQLQYYVQPKPVACQDPDQTGDFAAPFVTMNYTGNYGNTAAGGCDVDLYSRMLLGDPNTQRPKGAQQLFARPWATTPNMLGGAPQDAKDNESRLIQAVPVRNRKDVSTVTDKTFTNQWDPLLPELRNEIRDVNNWVESAWVRGGDPSRLVRNTRNMGTH
jgi:hypothetical protein